MHRLLLVLTAYSTHTPVALGGRAEDEIKRLPGLTFGNKARQYSGWLEVPSRNFIHYWLVESQSNPYRDPLILWLNGGPGGSSLLGLFTENGPFLPNPDGETLFEHVFSWNKFANMLYFESPKTVGYSYRDPIAPLNNTFNDDLSAKDNVDALSAFLDRFPEYKARDFYIAGESYGGVYVPTLAKLVIEAITAQPTSLPINLVGLAIGNGLISFKQQTNSVVDYLFYRGVIGKIDYEFLKLNCCPSVAGMPSQYCDFISYLSVQSNMDMPPVHNGDPLHDKCADAVYRATQEMVFYIDGYDAYDHNQDCYTDKFSADSPDELLAGLRLRSALDADGTSPLITDGIDRFVDQGSRVNTKSTDAFAGFHCYAFDALTSYLNRDDVRDAIHVPNALKNTKWMANKNLLESANYTIQHFDMTPFFKWYRDNDYPLKILVYNGDSDAVCNFLGAEWFVEALGFELVAEHGAWYYQQGQHRLSTVAGFAKKFRSGQLNVDLLTVKGAGHSAPTERPGPTFQMLANFVTGERNYGKPFPLQLKPKANEMRSRRRRQPLCFPHFHHGLTKN